MNIEQMTQKTREALQAAQRIAVEYSNNAVEQEHLLAALAQQQDGLTAKTIRERPPQQLRKSKAGEEQTQTGAEGGGRGLQIFLHRGERGQIHVGRQKAQHA